MKRQNFTGLSLIRVVEGGGGGGGGCKIFLTSPLQGKEPITRRGINFAQVTQFRNHTSFHD